jgi:hypothetical protein
LGCLSKSESSPGLAASGLVFALFSLSSPMAKADLTGALSYRTTWVTPTQKRIFTDSQGEVKAQLIVKRHIFDEGIAKTSATLRIVRKGKLAGSDSYVSKKGADIVNVSGPRLTAIGDQDEPAIRIQKQCYQEVYQYEYTYDDTTGHYKQGEPSLDASDVRSQPNTMKGFCTATSGNTTATLKWKQELYDFGGSDWELQIKRGRRVMLTKLLEPPALNGGEAKKDKTPECFGPYVTTSIDRRGKMLIDLRMTRIVDHARLGCEVIYYFNTRQLRFLSPRMRNLTLTNSQKLLIVAASFLLIACSSRDSAFAFDGQAKTPSMDQTATSVSTSDLKAEKPSAETFLTGGVRRKGSLPFGLSGQQWTAEDYRSLNYGIIGMKSKTNRFSKLDKVIAVFPDCPAQQVGIKPGDVIVKIADHTVDKKTTQKTIWQKADGIAGTHVDYVIRRHGELITFHLTRMNIEDIQNDALRQLYEKMLRELGPPGDENSNKVVAP